MSLMEIAHVPPIVVDISATVSEAIRIMVDNNVGAVAVVTEDKVRGIFSERDVMKKVIYHNLPPTTTPVAEVMTKEVELIGPGTSPAEALHLMLEKRFRHLPIVDGEGRVLGVLSIRDLFQKLVEELQGRTDSSLSREGTNTVGG